MEPIRSVYEDDPDMLELVREFAGELPERVRLAEELLEGGDMEGLQDLAHQLKGAGGGYGFARITEVAAVLESAIKEGAEPAAIKDRAGTLCEVLRAVVVSEAD